MSRDDYTEEEKRNLKLFEQWVDAGNTQGLTAKVIDEMYADSCEVFTPLQKAYYVRRGKSKADWKTVEMVSEQMYKKREMRIVNIVAKGDTVALEAIITYTTHDGNKYDNCCAVFLIFDKDGRIVSDHNYIYAPSPKSGNFPPGPLKEAMARIAADNQ